MKWKIIIRDAVLIFILTFIGTTLAGVALVFVDIPVGSGMVSIVFTVIGFTISGLLTRTDRPRHLLMVAVLYWVLGLSDLFLGIPLASWFASGIGVLFSCVVGGGTAAFLGRFGTTASPEDSAPRP